KGLGLPRETLDGRPRYVTDIDAHSGTVTVGTREDLRVGGIIADRLKRLDPEVQGREFDCEVQVRAHGGVVPARARLVDDPAPVTPAGRVKEADELPWRLELELLQTLEGVARGQAPWSAAPTMPGTSCWGPAPSARRRPWVPRLRSSPHPAPSARWTPTPSSRARTPSHDTSRLLGVLRHDASGPEQRPGGRATPRRRCG